MITGSGVMAILFNKFNHEFSNWKYPRQNSKLLHPTYGDWSKARIPDLEEMLLMKSYFMLQNVRFTVFIVSVLLTENQ